MTSAARSVALERLGYTPRQARFLTLAALHGGYFVRRQYVAFTGGQHGVAAVGFISRVLERGHVAVVEAPVMGRVYHVGYKPLYAALGDVDNRNRRIHSAASIRRRLMALDYVLAHQEDVFVVTERDQVAFFVNEHYIPRSSLPSTPYTSTDGRSTTTRYFVEKLPIARRATAVVFVYIDDDDATIGGFATFLERHRALLLTLRVPAHVEFVTTVPRHVTRAEACFEQRLGTGAVRRPLSLGTLGAYVLARMRLEEGRLAGTSQHELDALRRDLAAVPSATGDAVYRRWATDGAAALDAWVRDQHVTTPLGVVTFSGYLLPHSYGLKPGVRSYHG
jgi:hypothetical protein